MTNVPGRHRDQTRAVKPSFPERDDAGLRTEHEQELDLLLR